MSFPRIPKGVAIALDYETTGLDYWAPDFKAFGVAVATADAEWYWDTRTTPNLLSWLRDLLPGRLVIAQNAQYEYQVTRRAGIDPRSIRWYCTMVAECLIDEHQLTYDLDAIAKRNGVSSRKKEFQEQMATAMGWSVSETMRRLAEVPPDLVSYYGSHDARLARDVWAAQASAIRSQELEAVLAMEMELLPVLADMSFVGVRVDLGAAHAAIPALDEKESALQKEVDELAGRKFNVNSTPQIREFFKPEAINKFQYRLVDGTIAGSTKGNKGPSIDQKVLQESQHPLAKGILALRKTIKLRDTFIRGHVIASADGEGYVHTSFNQTRNDADAGTVTGRLSSTGPALQQITKRDKGNAAILRSMFLPDPGDEWLCNDYSQVDFRCGAHLINDPNIIAAYAADPSLDYHQIVADLTGIPRNAPYAGAPYAKQINLGLSFGAGAGKVAMMMNMPYEMKERRGKAVFMPGTEAQAVFDLYHKKLPGVKAFGQKAQNVAQATGFVRTAIGRRLRFPMGGEHKAAGLLYQSYAADLHKIGLIRTDRLIREEKLPARLMISVHDEMGTSSPPDPAINQKILSVYTNFQGPTAPIQMRVPITASGQFGANWWLACKD